MRIKAYTLDSLRKIIRELQKENKELRKLLKINNDFGGEIDKIKVIMNMMRIKKIE